MQQQQPCPKCEAELADALKTRPAIGKPFDVCSTCGGDIVRIRFNEWDLMGSFVKARIVSGVVYRSLLLGIAPAALYSVNAVVRGAGTDLQTLLALLIGGLLLSCGWWVSRFSKEVRRSRRRMGDPMYRARLMKFEMATLPADPT